MKVLHFFKTYWPDTFGGVERTIHAIAQSTASHGVETEVLSLSRFPDENTRRFDGHMARKARLDFDLASTGFSREVFGKFDALARKADLVHYHFPWPVMDMAHFHSRHGKPTVVTYHSDIVKQKLLLPFYRPLMTRFLKDVDAIVATSPDYLKSSPVLKAFETKSKVIPIGIDENAYPVPTEADHSWSRSTIAGPFVLFVGVLRYYKGLDILIQAADQVRCKIVIVGSGPVERQLKLQAKTLRRDNVIFFGRSDRAAQDGVAPKLPGVRFSLEPEVRGLRAFTGRGSDVRQADDFVRTRDGHNLCEQGWRDRTGRSALGPGTPGRSHQPVRSIRRSKWRTGAERRVIGTLVF